MAFEQKTMKRRNVKGLALKAAPTPTVAAPNRNGHSLGGSSHDIRHTEDPLEIGVEFRLDLNHEDLIVLKELGSGNGGTVAKVQHAVTGAIMARKVGLKRTETGTQAYDCARSSTSRRLQIFENAL